MVPLDRKKVREYIYFYCSTTFLPGPAKSVFEYMSEKDWERIEQIALVKQILGVHSSFSYDIILPPSSETTISTIGLHVGQPPCKASNHFKPIWERCTGSL